MEMKIYNNSKDIIKKWQKQTNKKKSLTKIGMETKYNII